MQYYYAVVHKDPDSAFGVHFPDLPGCFSAADALKDVFPNACEAVELYFEGTEDIVPRPLDAIREEVAGDLAEGAFLIAVPRVTSSTRLARVNVSFDRGTLAAIDVAAATRKLTRSAFLAEAARNEIRGKH